VRKARTTLTTVIAIGLLAGSAVGVAAQDEATAVEFTGAIGFGPGNKPIVEPFTDPRLAGQFRVWTNRDAYPAGTLVFAIGGVLLIAQPFDQQGGSVPGADAPSEPPTEFTGRLLFAPRVVSGTEEQTDGKTEQRGNVFRAPVSQMSDERLDGAWTRTNNLDKYDEPSVSAWQTMWRVVTDDGAWQGLAAPITFSDGSRSTTTSVLVGEGDYDGLVAITEFALEGRGWDLRGIIIDGELPPPPEAATVD
jgi:hypothetical protein